MNRAQLDLALERLQISDWERFEQFCSRFLVVEYPELRTMASPSGDGGRDAELFLPIEKNTLKIQYSITENWEYKIKETLNKLKKNFPDTRSLIYMTNQIIGAKGDTARKNAQDKGIFLDIRDRSWFLERFEQDTSKQSAAATLVDQVAMPYLEGKEVIQRRSYSLTSQEARAALVYLSMQWEDDITQKGLTKVAHEALVRAALRDTNSDYRLTRPEVHSRIKSYLTSANPTELEKFTNEALNHLEKRYIRYHNQDDSFCLMYDEVLRLRDKLAIQDADVTRMESEIKESIVRVADNGGVDNLDIPNLISRVRHVIDRFLLKSGETFAGSVTSGNVSMLNVEDVNNIVTKNISENPLCNVDNAHVANIVQQSVKDILSSPKEFIRKYLRKAADAYTLLSFLKKTPDVQSATKKIFSYGNIWLDTTVLLPLMVEDLKDEEEKVYSIIFKTILSAGVKLFVTKGVIQELSSHINLCISYSSYSIVGQNKWEGSIPYLFREYIRLGCDMSGFRPWLVNFKGDERPEDDLAHYLKHEYNISVGSLEEEACHVNPKLRSVIEKLWHDAHVTRRKGKGHGNHGIDDTVMETLVRHDIENYLGIIGLRDKESSDSELGYKNWWLTIDKLAWNIQDNIKSEFKAALPSPLISLDFLASELAFGQSRVMLTKESEMRLPVFLDIDFYEFIPPEIISVAQKVREENKDFAEHVIRRKVRDACDRARRSIGQKTQGAINGKQSG